MQVHPGAGVFANPPSGARHHRRAGPCPLVPPEDTAGVSALVDSPGAQTAHSQVRALVARLTATEKAARVDRFAELNDILRTNTTIPVDLTHPLARAREEVEATALAKAWARLAALAELEAATPQSLPGVLLPATRPEPADQYLARAATRPDIRALERAEAATELDHKAASRARVPELTLGAGWKGVQYANLRNDGFLINAGITLPVVDRGQGPRRRAQAEGQGLRGRAELARQELAGEIVGLRAEADRLHVLAEQFSRDRRRDSEELMRIADAAYRGGELGILELLDAYRGAVDDELQGLELALMARRARIELERAAGGGLP